MKTGRGWWAQQHEQDSNTPPKRPFGWTIVGTLFGALAGYFCVLYAPIPTTRWLTWHEMQMIRNEATLPLLFAGCVLGALAGWWAERRLSRKMTLSELVICLGLLFFIAEAIASALIGSARE